LCRFRFNNTKTLINVEDMLSIKKIKMHSASKNNIFHK
jgi:hypothetical protein